MNKKYQVFVSSTYTDLMDERQAVVEQILKQGHIPAGMELFRADDRSQKDIIRKWIEESDIYVLILGYRYGTIDSDSKISYTEWEYNLAVELNKPRIVLILSNDWLERKLNGAKLNENETLLPQYVDFKSKLRDTGRYAHEVGSIDNLKLKISENISFVIEDSAEQLVGWTREKSLIPKIDKYNPLSNIKISVKKVYSKTNNKPWGTFENDGEVIFSMPLWIEFFNTADESGFIKDVNLELYHKDKKLGKMTQIQKTDVEVFGNEEKYSFLLEPYASEKYTLYFAIKKSELNRDFDRVILTFKDIDDKLYEYPLVTNIKNSWEMGFQSIEDWEDVLF